ncbi:hypothetical protein ACVIIV_005096 [Bradyrhizobium sp. USDA 4354]
MLLRSLLVAFAGQVAVAAVLFVVICWRERVKRRREADQNGEGPPA